jgi:hypothetical protein
MTHNACSTDDSSDGETGEDKEENRRKKDIWMKLKLEEGIQDLLSSDSKEYECGEEERKQRESLLRNGEEDEMEKEYDRASR